MRGIAAGALFTVLIFVAQQAPAVEFIDRIPLETIVPPPPLYGSAIEREEIAEILKVQAAASPAALAQAKRDNDIEDATIFTTVLGPGWDLSKLPKTRFLIDRIMEVDRRDSHEAKKYFRRARPWIVDPKIQTCAAHGGGPSEDSYPSGHTMLGFEIGVVLASLMPNHAQAILARATQYGENRILCGFHFRSDVTAGEQFGTVLAVEMMENRVFGSWFNEARAELKAAALAR
jgi:acid phosphatase (class A)